MSTLNEQKEGEDKKPEVSADGSAAGNQPSPFEALRQADERIERLSRENERMERNIKELAALAVNDRLGGTTMLSQQKKAEDISNKDYAALALAGKLVPK